jgi:DUF1016 N-terminal domain
VIDQVSSDLRAAFPGMKGLSSRNLKYMKFFDQHCPDRQFVQQTAAQITQIGQQTAALRWYGLPQWGGRTQHRTRGRTHQNDGNGMEVVTHWSAKPVCAGPIPDPASIPYSIRVPVISIDPEQVR